VKRSEHLALGIDVGSVSVKVALLSTSGALLSWLYARSLGRPMETLVGLLEEALPPDLAVLVSHVGITGTGGAPVFRALGGFVVNEVLAQAEGVAHVLPSARSVVELGGQDSKFIALSRENGRVHVADFAMNALCAAGTGSFIDQQAARIGVPVENEFGEMSLRCDDPPRVAGRCSVFAKSDMIHLQQIGATTEDIVAGLCFAVARNYRGQILRGTVPDPPVAFVGGVAANVGVVRAFREVLDLEDLTVPPEHSVTAAIGCALAAARSGVETGLGDPSLLLEQTNNVESPNGHPPLRFDHPELKFYTPSVFQLDGGPPVESYLGVDVGSLSTNVVLIDGDGQVIARRYLMTAGRPIEAVARGFHEVAAEVGTRVVVRGVGVTGSGRMLIGELVGADIVRSEITAQAVAAVAFDPRVDTIFEIGGQDSKYVSLRDGVVVDFEMNRACAAGTGSFLQEQSERIGVDIEGEFARCALRSERPAACGERCTVFMESDITSLAQRGVGADDLASGLAYAIVANYLSRVVAGRPVGDRVFFQGGVASNKAVVAAFEATLGIPVIVPPHHDVTGAIGAALLAARRKQRDNTRFLGWDAPSGAKPLSSFTCAACENQCEIHRVSVEGEKTLMFGGRCERYEKSRSHSFPDWPDLFSLRSELLENVHKRVVLETDRHRGTVGIPLALMMWEYLPFFRALFESLGLRTVVTGRTTRPMISRGLERFGAGSCFPSKVVLGHVLELCDQDVDAIFWPSLINLPRSGGGENYLCPYVQASPYLVQDAVVVSGSPLLLSPSLHFMWGERAAVRELASTARALGAGKRELRVAVKAAFEAQRLFAAELARIGKDSLARLDREGQDAVVIVGRSYTTCDPGLSLDLPLRLARLGVRTLPMDVLPLDESSEDPSMYWRSGRRITAVSRFVANRINLSAIVVTNFGCGPDSFVFGRVEEAMGGEPYLTLELDEHAAEAGVMTRVETFLDGLSARARKKAAS
jgi:predicted CoA-substrate-specific enzyme activase